MNSVLNFDVQTIVNLILSAILIGIIGIWVYFLAYMIKSFRLSPKLASSANKLNSLNSKQSDTKVKPGDKILPTVSYQKVSVILPARNEEKYIVRCIESLLAQDYPDFEIIAINDSSTDRTGELIHQISLKDNRVKHIDARTKPAGWAGKNWACIEGYKRSEGELLLFTDADTVHSPSAISLAVAQMNQHALDALSAVPKLVCNDFWTRVTLPVLSVFLHTRFSALRVNDPKTKTGYFFGSFYIISRSAYEQVGTHDAVREELVEDGALGAKVKEAGLRLRMVRGEEQIKAVWARDLPSLWHGLRRLMIPLYYQNHTNAVLMTAAVFFILFEPFLLLPYTAFLASYGTDLSGLILWYLDIGSVALIVVTTAVQCKFGVYESLLCAFGAPFGGAMVSFGFISSIIDAKKKNSVVWRDRQYTVSEGQHPLH
jgi:chlorobactene glucosyltransferase